MSGPSLDDAIHFLIEYAREPRTFGHPSYGYDVYLPHVVNAYLIEIAGLQAQGQHLGHRPEGEAASPSFYEAAWYLCRRGIFRPGVERINGQGTDLGRDGGGYCLTAAGRAWLESADESQFIPMEPNRFARLIARFGDRFGEGYLRRAQEAAKCHFATAYLACCAMSGAAAESILLELAIAKAGNEDTVLKTYWSAKGRKRITDLIVGQVREPLASQFRNLLDLLNYWRDEAGHGAASDLSEFEAYEALAKLLRLAHFADDHWDELTKQSS